MKTTINIIIATALLAVATSATAKSWRINNNAAAAPDFASINAAMSSADVLAGDTLYLDPGTSLSGDQTVSKQVTIVGPGYFRSDTPHAFAYLQSYLYITAASTKVEGVIMLGEINIRASDVTIERCKYASIHIGYYYSNAQFAKIRQCYGGRIYGEGGNSNYSSYCTIENSIIIESRYSSIYNLYLPKIRPNYIKEATNSYLFNDLGSATITDNVIINASVAKSLFTSVSNSVNVSHNVMSGTENASYPDNIYGGTEAAIFTLTGMNDQRYQLKDDSPAKGYATDEGDCGPYGGLTPYVAGGLPNGYPYYTKAIIPAKSKDGKVNVSLKIKMQNE